ncbi:MAG: hypothetical protein JW828_04185 [Sedimentisphaerales bacterium]|nr:hypothetical protein [Sedimentisphaerales bacterium]
MPELIRAVTFDIWNECDPSQIPADLLSDLNTKDNQLSVYSNEGEANVNRIAVALAANRRSVKEITCLLFEDSLPQSIGIEQENTKGSTKDAVVNEAHRDLISVKAAQLLVLAEKLAPNFSKHHLRLMPDKVVEHTTKAIVSGQLSEVNGDYLIALTEVLLKWHKQKTLVIDKQDFIKLLKEFLRRYEDQESTSTKTRKKLTVQVREVIRKTEVG